MSHRQFDEVRRVRYMRRSATGTSVLSRSVPDGNDGELLLTICQKTVSNRIRREEAMNHFLIWHTFPFSPTKNQIDC